MKTNRLRDSLIIFVLSALFIAIIYTTNPDRIITLRLGVYAGSSWDVPYADSYHLVDQIIKAFEKKHPHVKVKYVSGITKEDYSSWLSDKLIQGQQCDVFMVPTDDFNLLADTSGLENLNSLIGNSYTDVKAFYPSALAAGEVNNRVYALPFESNPMMMCVNMDLLKKEGITLPSQNWTFQDFYKICRKVTKDTDGNGELDQFGVTGYTWQEALEENGAALFNDDGTECYLNSEKVRKALSSYARLVALNGHIKVSQSDFDTGKVAFMPMSLAQYRTYRSYPYRVSRYSKFRWRSVPMPGSSRYKIHMPTTLFAISSHSSHKQAAWLLLNDLTLDVHNQQALFKESSGSSVLKKVMTSKTTQKILKNDNMGSQVLTSQTINQMMTSSSSSPHFKKYNEVMELANNEVTLAIEQGSLDSDLPSIESRIENMLTK